LLLLAALEDVDVVLFAGAKVVVVSSAYCMDCGGTRSDDGKTERTSE
jgi:hypothetical protein